MNNFGTLYRYEIKKILGRKLTLIVFIVVFGLLAAVNAAEYVAVRNEPECNDDSIVGRELNDVLFDEMREGIIPEMMTDSMDNVEVRDVTYGDSTFRNLFKYLLNCCGNNTKAYNVSEAELKKRFNEIIDYAYEDFRLTSGEIAYWEAKRADISELPLYDKSAGWSNSIVNLYMANFFILITIGSTLSGIYSDEYSLRTDAIVFASANGKKRLSPVKFLAGCTVGLAETVFIILANSGLVFLLYGAADHDASIRLVYGPTLMDMPVRKAFIICAGILLVIGLFYSVLCMLLSQVFKNPTAPIAVMAVLLICSMLNPPNSFRIISQIASYLPATFPGSWTFCEYRLLNIFGLRLNNIQAMPLLYFSLVIILAVLTGASYKKTEIKGR